MVGSVSRLVHHFGSDWNISRTIGRNLVQIFMLMNGWLKMIPTDCGDPMIFPVAPAVGQSLNLSSEISWHLLDGSVLFLHAFMVPRWCIPVTMKIPCLSSCAAMRLAFVDLSEMSQQLLGGLPWNLVHTFMSSTGWFVKTLVIHWLYLAPSSSQIFNFSNTLVYEQIPAKLMPFPWASAVLDVCF